jgi:hypothetical protein
VAAGEDIGVVVTFRNPLQVKLALSRVRLHLQFTHADKATPGAAAPAASAAAGAGGGDAVSPEDVLVMESQFSLHPGKEQLLCRAVPCRAVLCGAVRCMRRQQAPPAHRGMRCNSRLALHCIGGGSMLRLIANEPRSHRCAGRSAQLLL